MKTLNKTFIVIILCILYFNTSGQEVNNQVYFKNLADSLLKRESIEKILYEKRKYLNGNIKTERLFVKYFSDSKYWLTGNEFVYHKNGQLSDICRTDINSNILVDSLFVFNPKGEIVQAVNYGQSSSSPFSIRIMSSIKTIFHNCVIAYPFSYEVIDYFDDGSIIKYHQVYDKDRGSHLTDGLVIFYDKDGIIIKQEEYNMGNLVK